MQMSFVQYALESQSNFYEPPQQQRNTLDAARFERKFTRHPHSSAYHSLFSFITFTGNIKRYPSSSSSPPCGRLSLC
jgi:hypothetical protein